MALTLYRRHRRECKAGHPHQFRSSEFEERKRGWKRCECPIVVAGTLNKKFVRQSTNKCEWDDARSVAAAIETSGSWDDQVTPVLLPEPLPKSDPTRFRICSGNKILPRRNSGNGGFRHAQKIPTAYGGSTAFPRSGATS